MLQLNGYRFALSDLQRYVKSGGFIEEHQTAHGSYRKCKERVGKFICEG